MLLPHESSRAMDLLMLLLASASSFFFGALCGVGVMAALDHPEQCNRPHLVMLEEVVPAVLPASTTNFLRPLGVPQ